ncbi:MAG: hypothetical protein IJ558_12480 [Treponema sp.]|nr:hypothetical protein [Treponema sp.]
MRQVPEKKPKDFQLLIDHIDTILNGTPEEKSALAMHYYKVADTPDFLKELGLRGESFIIKYGVITRHRNKNEDHKLTVQNWKDICEKITAPLAVAEFKGNYRLFVDTLWNGKYVMVGVDVVQMKNGMVINSITTAFARNNNNNATLLYTDKKITAEKLAFLTQHIPAQYPDNGGVSPDCSDTVTIAQEVEKSRGEN